MCSDAQSQQKSLSVAWQGRVSELRSWMKPLPTSPTAATRTALAMWSLHRAVLLDFRLWRAEELGDDLDREHAVDSALVVHHRRVLGLALEQVGEGVAHDVVAVEQRAERGVGAAWHDVGTQVALGEPAERPALAVDQQRVGDLDLGRGKLRPHL